MQKMNKKIKLTKFKNMPISKKVTYLYTLFFCIVLFIISILIVFNAWMYYSSVSKKEINDTATKVEEYIKNGGEITNETIDKLTIKQIESVIFDLTDSLGKKNTKVAIEVLRNLILAKEPVQKILITLYSHFKKLYLVKLALKNNKDIIYALDLKPNQTFLVNKYKMQAGYFKTSEVRKILKELCDLDYKYKIGLIDLEVGFESILCAYC